MIEKILLLEFLTDFLVKEIFFKYQNFSQKPSCRCLLSPKYRQKRIDKDVPNIRETGKHISEMFFSADCFNLDVLREVWRSLQAVYRSSRR